MSIVKENIVYLLIGILLGGGTVLIITMMTSSPSLNYKQWKQTEEFKRDSLNIRISTLREERRERDNVLDSMRKRSDSILISKEKVYEETIKQLKSKRDERLDYIDTVDSAYIVILSRE